MKSKTIATVAAAAALTLFDIAGASAQSATTVVDTPSWTGAYIGAQFGRRFDDPKGPIKLNTFTGGGKVGYDFQATSNIVVGVIGDFSWGRRSRGASGPFALGGFDGVVLATGSVNVKHTWDAGIRARAGLLVTDSLLVYGVGGVAFLREKVTAAFDAGPFGSGSASSSKTRVGYSVGVGVEAAVTGNIHVNVEYRYSDFGSKTYKWSGIDVSGKSKVDTHTVMTGVSYRF